jgi:hypothetical protein
MFAAKGIAVNEVRDESAGPVPGGGRTAGSVGDGQPSLYWMLSVAKK